MNNETGAVSTRARKQASGKKAENPAAGLLAALKFVSVAQKKSGPVETQFCRIFGGFVTATNGVLTAGARVEEDLQTCPHTMQMIAALSKVAGDVSIVQLSENALSVASGSLRALVPCVTFAQLPQVMPDESCATIDDRIKTAFADVSGLATEGAPNATYAAVLLQAQTAVATNGAALLEAWHGIDLPPGMMLPKCAAVAVAKAKPSLQGFGFSQSSATFWFEDGSFIKSQLYAERFPNYVPLIEVENLNLWPMPDDLFIGIKAIEQFVESGNVFFDGDSIASSAQAELASSYKIEGLPERMGFNLKLLLQVEHAFKKAHFLPSENKVVFYGDNVRGVLMGLCLRTEASEDTYVVKTGDNYEDDVPF